MGTFEGEQWAKYEHGLSQTAGKSRCSVAHAVIDPVARKGDSPLTWHNYVQAYPSLVPFQDVPGNLCFACLQASC